MATVKIISLHNFSYNDQNGSWSGSSNVEIVTQRGQFELSVPFQNRDLQEAQIAILIEVADWAREVEQAAQQALQRIPKTP